MTFSTLKRVEVNATLLTFQGAWHFCRLSVPSNGSKSMQQKAFERKLLMLKDFQYPQTGRSQCNSVWNNFKVVHRASFSTLKRVEVNATIDPRFVHSAAGDFQYPQTGRSQCNRLINALLRLIYDVCMSAISRKSLFV